MNLKIKTPSLSLLFLLAITTPTTLSAQNWDIDLLNKINPQDPGSGYWHTTSNSANWLPAVGITTTFLTGTIQHNKKLQQESYKALVNIAISTAVSQLLKISIQRTRPALAYPTIVYEAEPIGSATYSFPSGHTTLAFTYATTLTLQYKKWYVAVPAYLWAGSVGYSRMYLGKHYPTDVLAGAVLGTISTLLSDKLNKKLFKRK